MRRMACEQEKIFCETYGVVYRKMNERQKENIYVFSCIFQKIHKISGVRA